MAAAPAHRADGPAPGGGAARLLERELVLVTGKGGTGKTTLAAAIGLVLARRGHRTLVAEIDLARPSLGGVLGVEPTYRPRAARDRLDVCNVTWREGMSDWLEETMPVQRIVRLILGHRLVQLFLDATPGVRETVVLARLHSLLRRYDRVVVDLPASGHALSMLRVPYIAAELMRSGPIRERSLAVIDLFRTGRAGLVVVALPEEMVVNETLELLGGLGRQVPDLPADLVVLNQAARPSLRRDERELLRRLGDPEPANPAARALVAAGRWEARLEEATATALDRLGRAPDLSLVDFPRLGELGGYEGGPGAVVEQMARALERCARPGGPR